MSDSLQDQLKALGLSRSKPSGKHSARQNKPARPGDRKQAAKPPQDGELSLQKAYALKRREEQELADNARKKKQAEDKQRRLLNNQIREIVKAKRLNSKDAEVARNFLFKGRIRKIHVKSDQLKALNTGKLGIVYLSGGYHLLDLPHFMKVRELSAEHVVELGTSEEDDGDFPVPDDLNW